MSNPTPSNAGWYDDPDNPEQLRYFDGILWTGNVTPRRTREIVDPPSDTTGTPPMTHGPTAGLNPSAPTGQHPGLPTNPYAGSPTNYSGAPPIAGGTAYQRGPTTADGAPLASYAVRVGAYLIDAVITGVLGMLAGGWFLWRAIEPVIPRLQAAIEAQDEAAINAAMTAMDARELLWFSVVTVLVSIAYNLFFLTRWSATPGKLLCGISVRRADAPGVLDLGTAGRRVAFEAGLSALGNLPFVGIVALGVRIVDLLWPLSDRQRQTLHDKFAATVVVQGRQRKS